MRITLRMSRRARCPVAPGVLTGQFDPPGLPPTELGVWQTGKRFHSSADSAADRATPDVPDDSGVVTPPTTLRLKPHVFGSSATFASRAGKQVFDRRSVVEFYRTSAVQYGLVILMCQTAKRVATERCPDFLKQFHNLPRPFPRGEGQGEGCVILREFVPSLGLRLTSSPTPRGRGY